MQNYNTLEAGLSDSAPLVPSKPNSKKTKAAASLLVIGAFALGFAAAASVTPSTKTASKFVVYDGPNGRTAHGVPGMEILGQDVPDSIKTEKAAKAASAFPDSSSEEKSKIAPRLASDVFDTSSKLTSTSAAPSDNVLFDLSWGNWSDPPVVEANSPHFTIYFTPEGGPETYFNSTIWQVDKAVYDSCDIDAGDAGVFFHDGNAQLGVTTFDWSCQDDSCTHPTDYYTSGDYDNIGGCAQGKKFSVVYKSEPVCAMEKRALLACLKKEGCWYYGQPMVGEVHNSSDCRDYGAGGAFGADVCNYVYTEIMETCDKCTDLGQAAAECSMAYAVKNYQVFDDGWTTHGVPGIDCNCKDMCWYDVHGQGYDEHTCKNP